MNKLVVILQRLDYVNDTNIEIISYGLKRILELIKDISITLLCSLLLGNITMGILFELVYIPLRIYAGGYHASTPQKCSYLSYGSMIGCLTIIFFFPIKKFILHVCMLLFTIIILIHAPAESPNKVLSVKEKKVFRRNCVYISIIEILLYCIFIFLHRLIYAKTIMISTGLIAISIVAALIQKQQFLKKYH